MGNCSLWYYRSQLFISLGFRKCKKDGNVLRDILVQCFYPPKTEIARFPIGVCLNLIFLMVLKLCKAYGCFNRPL